MYNRKTIVSTIELMTGPLNTATSQPSSVQPQVLYGTGTFQVRLWTLEPGGQIPVYPQGTTTRSQSFLISGQVSAQGAPLSAGQRLEALSNAPVAIANTGSQTATLLEICQGQGFTEVPLPEITETRPWGSFTVLKDEPHYKLKQLMAKPGNRLSLQRHQHREEHWLVMQGHPEITRDEDQIPLGPGDYIQIPQHSWHRLANLAQPDSGELVEIIELQLGTYFGEDDIERREDDYGRT